MGYSLYLPALLLVSLAISVCDSFNLDDMNVNLAYGVVKDRFVRFYSDVEEAERMLIDTTMDDKMKQTIRILVEQLKSQVNLMYQSYSKLTPPLHYSMHNVVTMTDSAVKLKFKQMAIVVNKLREYKPKFTTPSSLSPTGIFAKTIDDVKNAASNLMTLFKENYLLLSSSDKNNVRSIAGDAKNKAKLYAFFYEKFYKDKPRNEVNDASVGAYTRKLMAIMGNIEKLTTRVNDLKDKEQQRVDEEKKLIETIVKNLGIKSNDVTIIKKLQECADRLDHAKADFAATRAHIAKGKNAMVRQFKIASLDVVEPEVEVADSMLQQAINDPNVSMADLQKVSDKVSAVKTSGASWLHMYGPKKILK